MVNNSKIDPETQRVLNDLRRWRSSRSIEQVLSDLRRDMRNNPTLRALVAFTSEELTRDDNENSTVEPD